MLRVSHAKVNKSRESKERVPGRSHLDSDSTNRGIQCSVN